MRVSWPKCIACFFVFLFTPPGILIFDQFNVASLPANLVAIPALGFVILPLV
ncbi:MAG: ComEC/Rec2 family competence protein, partial [Rhodothermales bacterium]